MKEKLDLLSKMGEEPELMAFLDREISKERQHRREAEIRAAKLEQKNEYLDGMVRNKQRSEVRQMFSVLTSVALLLGFVTFMAALGVSMGTVDVVPAREAWIRGCYTGALSVLILELFMVFLVFFHRRG